MKTYEYITKNVLINGWDPTTKKEEKMDKMMNEMAKKGWELFKQSSANLFGTETILIFRRKKD